MIDRRSFLTGSVAGTLALACGSRKEPPPSTAPTSAAPPVATTAKKTILILGGTNFIGPHIVDAARARGHTLTLFNRGKTHPNLFPDLEKLQGDRDGKLEALHGRSWDAVVDTSGFVPRKVKATAELLATSGQYLFISSVSVYDKPPRTGVDETGATPFWHVDDIESAFRDLVAAGATAVQEAMKNAEPNFRVLGLRVARATGANMVTFSKPFLRDPSPKVRREIALMLQDHATMLPA